MSIKIDLAYFFVPGKTEQIDWQYGEKRALALPAKHLMFTLDCLLQQTTAEWILFWDYSLGQPDIELIKKLAHTPIDAWHAGLKCGLTGVPQILDYIDPTWMYNKDASKDVEHSSFRLSIRACLIRTSVFRKTNGLSSQYSSLEMSGVALGYKILKEGGIIRYHPSFVTNTELPAIKVPQQDEWVFLRQFFPKKWQIWTVLNKKGLLKNYRLWRNTRQINRLILKPCIHPSDKVETNTQVEKVSVLVPTLDRYSYLLNELEQLATQTILPFEILITDQTDKERRINIDTTKYPNLTIKYYPQDEKGQCVAWNKLLEEATGDYVLFLGDDADGIKPDFIEQLLASRKRFDSDMVASHVIELGISYEKENNFYHLSSTFPITLIKRSLLLKTGFMNMFFNKNVRADHDLAMRCHLNGALLIYDPSAVVYHHRAPSGGLRAHKARVVTNFISKNSINKFATPTSSEIYLVKKYFTPAQYKSYMRISYFNQLITNGNILRKVSRLLVFIFKSPAILSQYKKNKQAAEHALAQ